MPEMPSYKDEQVHEGHTLATPASMQYAKSTNTYGSIRSLRNLRYGQEIGGIETGSKYVQYVQYDSLTRTRTYYVRGRLLEVGTCTYQPLIDHIWYVHVP